MIEGNTIDEIRRLPKKQVYHHALTSVENQLLRAEITTENALDICSKIVMEYQQNKKQILADLNQNEKIIIVDAIMGAGKSTFMINEVINKNPQRHYLCVLPTLKECERYAQYIEADTFEPRKYGTKTKDLQRLIAHGRNIVTTHALITNIDDVTIDLLKKSNYVLIIDECLDVVHQYERNFKSSDLKSIFNDGYVITDDKGFLIWNSEKEKDYDGRWNDIKQLCNLHSLMRLKKEDGNWSDKILIWNFPVTFFSLFEKCYICTYLWNGSMQKAYFDMHNIKYFHMTLLNSKLDVYNPTKELMLRERYWKLINLYSGKLNEIGVPDRTNKNPLTSTWYQKKAKDEKGRNYLSILKNNTYNFFRNIVKTSSDENMYTTFKLYCKYIKGAGYAKGFVSCNAKGTNDYRNKGALAYLINLYPHPTLVHFFESHGVTVNQDLYALSEVLQWIWRSRIREGKPINLYMPSLRMRELLGRWAIGRI